MSLHEAPTQTPVHVVCDPGFSFGYAMATLFSTNVRTNADSVVMELLGAAQETPEAVMRALNKMAEQGKVAGAREVRAAGYNLKIGAIKKGIKVRRATKSELRASVIATGKPVPLIEYGARQTAKGVSVSVLKGRKVIAGAFIATMPSGHSGVFVREQGAKHKKVGQGKQASWHALPIKELFGPSVPDGMGNKAVQVALQRLFTEKFPTLLEHEHQWLSKRGRR